jgi:hypothetical protein
MTWRKTGVMEEKLRFVFEYERNEQTEMCQKFGIARATGYVWLGEFYGQMFPATPKLHFQHCVNHHREGFLT